MLSILLVEKEIKHSYKQMLLASVTARGQGDKPLVHQANLAYQVLESGPLQDPPKSLPKSSPFVSEEKA